MRIETWEDDGGQSAEAFLGWPGSGEAATMIDKVHEAPYSRERGDMTMPQTAVGKQKERMGFKSLATMRQGTASSLPGAWERYTTLDDARIGARQMLRDNRVLRVMIVNDGLSSRFVEWIER